MSRALSEHKGSTHFRRNTWLCNVQSVEWSAVGRHGEMVVPQVERITECEYFQRNRIAVERPRSRWTCWDAVEEDVLSSMTNNEYMENG